jgi:hypothetical protein
MRICHMRKTSTVSAGGGFRAWFVPLVALLTPLSVCRGDVNKPLIEAGKKATALVEIYDGKDLKGWATAFCIDKSGVFVTNNHVATTGSKNNKLTLVIDAGTRTQRSLAATVLKTDADTDLAILRADHAGPYESLELADPASIRGLAETTQVTVFGYPFGEALAMRDDARPEASVTLSRIMALRHDHGELHVIQLDGSINHGNSGGPVVDERGKVIGIIAAGIPGTAISFAIPANRVGKLLVEANLTLTSKSPADAAAVFAAALADGEGQPADPPNRASLPDDAARKVAQKAIRELLASEFADSTPKGKRVLAAALLARGLATTDDPAGCYELLSEACDAAIDSADLDTAMKAVSELGRRYEINTLAQKVSVLTRLAPKQTSPADAASAAAHGLLAAQALVHRDLYADAQRLVPIVHNAAAASYNVQVQTQVRDKLDRVEAACAQYALAEPAIKELKTNPNDVRANLIVGRFECFIRGDFDKGLPLLAKGADPAMQAAAAADLAKPSSGPACKAVGDDWWDQAAKETKDAVAAEQCKARAGYWYRLGVAQLDGLAKTLVEQRLASLPEPATGHAAVPGLVGASSAGAKARNVADSLADMKDEPGQSCTAYVIAALKHAGFDTTAVAGQEYTVADAINMNSRVIKASEDLETLVKHGDERTKGVVAALVASGQGDEVEMAQPGKLKRGDIVQYWYYSEEAGKKVLMGHTAVVLGGGKKVRLQGSQQGQVGEIQTGFTKVIKAYAVRPKVS